MPKCGSIKCKSCLGYGICAVNVTPRHAICAAFLKSMEALNPSHNSSSLKMPSYADAFCDIGLPATCDERKGGIKMYEYIARHFGR
jgi:hypothetical protein